MVQKINKTSLKPDFGCFVLFDGGFTFLVVINFTAKAALEVYTNYMRNMGMPEEELAVLHTSDEVGDVLGELMNQLVGDFTNKVRKELHTNITQNQPKMLSLNKQVLLSVDTNLDPPQARRVTFSSANNNIFNLELAMDNTEFIQLEEFDVQEDESPDDILAATQKQQNHIQLLTTPKKTVRLLICCISSASNPSQKSFSVLGYLVRDGLFHSLAAKTLECQTFLKPYRIYFAC